MSCTPRRWALPALLPPRVLMSTGPRRPVPDGTRGRVAVQRGTGSLTAPPHPASPRHPGDCVLTCGTEKSGSRGRKGEILNYQESGSDREAKDGKRNRDKSELSQVTHQVGGGSLQPAESPQEAEGLVHRHSPWLPICRIPGDFCCYVSFLT